MQLFFGGAFAGKRKIVKQRFSTISWLSTYNGDKLENWQEKWTPNTVLVLEGWEKWVNEHVHLYEEDAFIRKRFNNIVRCLEEEEKKRQQQVIFIMLELGKGIVPLEKIERRTRDINGWINQDAAKRCNNVEYVWNGLSKKIK